VRLNFADSAGRKVKSSSYYSQAIAALYSPTVVNVGDSDQTLSSKNGVKLGIGFIAKGAPSATVDFSNTKTLKLKLVQVQVAQPSDFMSFQEFIRSHDGKAGTPDNIKNLFAQINTAGDRQRKTGAMTPYWVITKVFTAEKLEYSSTSAGGLKGGAKCGSETVPCVVGAKAITADVDLTKDKQSILNGDHRPIFVVIKPVGVNSAGSLYIEEDAKAPEVLAS